MCVNFISELCLPAATDIATYSLSLSACRRSVSPSLSLFLSPDALLAARALKASSLGFSDKSLPPLSSVAHNALMKRRQTDRQTTKNWWTGTDYFLCTPRCHPFCRRKLIFLFVVVSHTGKFNFPFRCLFSWISSILPQGKSSFFSCSHGCPPSCRRKPKKNILFVVVVLMDVIHPITGKSKFSFCCGCHPSCFRNNCFFPRFVLPMDVIIVHPVAGKFFGPFVLPMDVIHPSCFRNFFFPSPRPFYLFPWMFSILSAKKLILFFGTLGQIICCTHWMSSLLSHRTFFLIT